jgi:polyferredoxin
VMDKMGTAPWLITWDTLARQKARAAGKPEKLHLLRARTMIYVGAFALCLGTLTYGLVTRPTTTLSAIHDRAPVYVRLRDGSIRNGYTLKLANKTQAPAAYTLRVQGLAGGMISAPEQSPAFSDQLALHVPAGSVGDVRVLVQGHPQMPAGGEQTLIFALFDQQTGKTSRHGALFLSPAAEGTP